MANVSKSKRVLVTGGAGFIGSALVARLASHSHKILTIDNLTYAANTSFIETFKDHHLLKIDICNSVEVKSAISRFAPDLIFHLAAESHVDRSIQSPEIFIETNIKGTFELLSASLEYFETLPASQKRQFKFVHISSDEVFGSLEDDGYFNEQTRYNPSSPYSASKAAADHLVKAWHSTYGLPVCISNCSNNYGPRQHAEKLIPMIIQRSLNDEAIPIYGNGKNVRDWLYVEDHIDALLEIANKGKAGERYCVGGGAELTNLEVATIICSRLDLLKPRDDRIPYREQIEFVEDRLGHDYRYAIDTKKIENELNWRPKYNFHDGIKQTVDWFIREIY